MKKIILSVFILGSFLFLFCITESKTAVAISNTTADHCTLKNAQLNAYLSPIISFSINDYVIKPVTIIFIVAIAALSILLSIVLIYSFRKKYDSKLYETMIIDPLTKIYNKTYFFKKTEENLKTFGSSNYVMVVLKIVDFNLINEFYGVDESNRFLSYVAKVIHNSFFGNVKISYGIIEDGYFAWCLPYEDRYIEELVKRFDAYLEDYHITFKINVVFGVYAIGEKNITAEDMYHKAVFALKTIPSNSRKRYAYYDKEMSKEAKRVKTISAKAHNALKNNEFVVYLQPKYSLDDESLVGAEALVRWNDSEEGLISPGDFIPIFENNGFIVELDYFVWDETCKILRKWLDEGKEPFPISVNVSRVDLFNPNFCDELIELTKKYDLDPRLLELELTESIYTDNSEYLKEIINLLQDSGFSILMDDFGSGYSSLNMLKEFPIDVLKVDMGFLNGEKKDEKKGRSVLASIIRMAKLLNLLVIVEGIETKTQKDFLRSAGCDQAQGYYYNQPMPIEEYEKLCYANKDNSKMEYRKRFDTDEIWIDGGVFEGVFNTSIDALGIYEFQADRIEALRLNDRYFEVVHATRHEYFNHDRNALLWIYEEDRPRMVKLFETAAEEKKAKDDIFRRKLIDGQTVWLHIRVKFVDDIGTGKLFYVALSDITELKEKEAMLNFAINNASLGVIQCLHDGTITGVNNSLLSMLGCQEEDLINKDIKNLSSVEDPKALFASKEVKFNMTVLGKEYDVSSFCYSGNKTNILMISIQ